MKRALLSLLCAYCLGSPAGAAEQQLLRLKGSVPLPNIQGRIDHFGIDPKKRLLYVAAYNNNTVQIIDIERRAQVSSIGGLAHPQDVLFIPRTGKLYISNYDDGDCRVFDAKTLAPVAVINYDFNADALGHDPGQHRIYIAHGTGGIGVIDTDSDKSVGDVVLTGHAEAFQVETKGKRVFVNVPAENHVVVIDREGGAIETRWVLQDAQNNYPMALDEENRRLFVGCRDPGLLVVFDTGTGRITATAPLGNDADDLFYDAARRRLYASCGEGTVDIIEQRDPDRYERTGRIPTASGAGTSLFSPGLNLFFVAVPGDGGRTAEIRIYDVQNP